MKAYRLDEHFCEWSDDGKVHRSGWRPIAYFKDLKLAHEVASMIYDDLHIVEVDEMPRDIKELTRAEAEDEEDKKYRKKIVK